MKHIACKYRSSMAKHPRRTRWTSPPLMRDVEVKEEVTL
jgi:hypothetical protein